MVDKRQGGNAAKLKAEEIEHLQTMTRMMSQHSPNQKYGKGRPSEVRLFESRVLVQKQVKSAIGLSIEGTLSFRKVAAARKSKQAKSPVIQDGKNMG